jgi:hypothetical protein
MKITRERKIFGGLLIVALAALAFDQLGGGGTSSDIASAAVAGQENASALLLASSASASPATRSNSNAAADEPSLAQRLKAAAPIAATVSPDHIRDVFRIPRAWLGNGQPAPVTQDAATLAAERFAQSHKLSAVSKSASGGGAGGLAGIAVVDGNLLHPGAVVDGFKLVAVTRTSAIFDCGGAQVVLQLKTDPSGAASIAGAGAGASSAGTGR